MNGKELREFCNGKVVPIIFTKDIEEFDHRFEEGMKAYIVGVSEADMDNVICVKIEERDFSDFNKSIEKSICLNSRTGAYDLKWSESLYCGGWTGSDSIYEMENQEINNFKILDDNKIKLFEFYKEQNSELSYNEWLEYTILNSNIITFKNN